LPCISVPENKPLVPSRCIKSQQGCDLFQVT
jgi:hypothetical protein